MMESMRHLHVVLFIGVLCVVRSVGMMCPYSDPACTKCNEKIVNCYNLSKFPPLNTGANVYPVKKVHFEGGNITSLSKENLPPGLTEVFFHRVPLVNISEDAFDASATTLTYIDIYKAKFTSLPRAFMKLTSLTILSLTDVPIEDWDETTLKHIALRLVSFHGNYILTSWPSWISEFKVLEILNLGWNTFKYIPDDAFSSMKESLTTLYLSEIGFTYIPFAVSTLPNLIDLEFAYNNLTDLLGTEIIGSYSSGDSNGKPKVANISQMTHLERLILSNNKLSDIPAGSLPLSIKYFSLADNNLTSVPKDLASMSKLEKISLNWNHITQIESNSFPLSLNMLHLDSNNITVITDSTFGNSQLEYLSLNNNPISKISPAAFSRLPRLRLLNITGSHLKEIPQALTSLEKHVDIEIHLSTNKTMACPCPASRNILLLYDLLPKFYVYGNCSTGQGIGEYLFFQCKRE